VGGGHSTGVGEIYDPYAAGGPAGGAAGIGLVRARSARFDPGDLVSNPYAAALQQGGTPYPQFAVGPYDTTYGAAAAGGPSFGRGNIPGGPYTQRSPPPQENTNFGRSLSNSTAATRLSAPSQSHTLNFSQPSHPVRQMSPLQQYQSTSHHSPPLPETRDGGLPNPYPNEGHPTHKVEPSRESADDAYAGYVEGEEEEEVPKRVLKIANES